MAAGEWIKWTKGLEEKPEVLLMASRLGREPEEIAGRLMKLWRWCDDHVSEKQIDPATKDVTISIGDRALAFVDTKLGLPGMAEAMASPEVGWLIARSGGRITFPGLAHHNLKTAKIRAADAKKKASARFGGGEDATEIPPEEPVCPDSVPTPTGQKREQIREDKDLIQNPPPRLLEW